MKGSLKKLHSALISEALPGQAPVTPGASTVAQPVAPARPGVAPVAPAPQAAPAKPDPKALQAKALEKKSKLDQIAGLQQQINALKNELKTL